MGGRNWKPEHIAAVLKLRHLLGSHCNEAIIKVLRWQDREIFGYRGRAPRTAGAIDSLVSLIKKGERHAAVLKRLGVEPGTFRGVMTMNTRGLAGWPATEKKIRREINKFNKERGRKTDQMPLPQLRAKRAPPKQPPGLGRTPEQEAQVALDDLIKAQEQVSAARKRLDRAYREMSG